MATAKELRDKLAAKQDELGAVFKQARSADDGLLDYNKVTCLGDEVKGSVDVAEKVRQMDLEMNEIAKEAETIEAADQAAEAHAKREKAGPRPTHAATGSAKGTDQIIFKTLSEQIAERDEFKAWQDAGANGGVMMKFPEMLGSDFIAGSKIMTLRQKTLMQISAGYDPNTARLPGFVEDATRPITLLDIIPLSRTDTDTVVYMEETTRTHAAAEKAEGVAYAESAFVFTERTSPVQKITDSLPVTDEQLADAAFVGSYINDRLAFGIRQRLDLQVLVGDGTPPNLKGIKNVSNVLTRAKGGDPIPDVFYKAMVSIRVTGRATPTHHIIHPTDWQTVRLDRTSDGVYIWGSPSDTGTDRMWGLPVVVSDNDSAGTGYVGSFQPAWITLVERAGVQVEVGFVGDQFKEGKRTIRAQMRAAFILFRPEAFSLVTGL